MSKDYKNNVAKLKISFVNPRRLHGTVFQAMILCDGNAEPIKVKGEGRGWSVRHKKIPTERKLRIRSLIWLVFLGLGIGGAVAYEPWMRAALGISQSWKNWAIVNVPPLMGLTVFFIWFMIWIGRHLLRREVRP